MIRATRRFRATSARRRHLEGVTPASSRQSSEFTPLLDLHRRVERSPCVRIHHYEVDDSVFADDVYVIKGLAGRILWLLLTLYRTTGRSTFSTRELRLHPYLKLPIWKNNLEARLLLLQRRLDARAVAFRLCREQRGQVRVLCSAPLDLHSIQPVARAEISRRG